MVTFDTLPLQFLHLNARTGKSQKSSGKMVDVSLIEFTRNASDGNADMSFISKKLGSSLDLHDLEQFIGKKCCVTRQRDGINRYDSNNLSTCEEVQSSLNRSTKNETFESPPSSVFCLDIDTQFDKDICCGNWREGLRGKSNGVLEHGFMKYLIDQTGFLSQEITEKNKMIDGLFALKLSLRDKQNFLIKMFKLIKALINLITKLFSTTWIMF